MTIDVRPVTGDELPAWIEVLSAAWTFETKRSTFSAPAPDPGSVELVAPSREMVADLIAVHDASRRRQAGEIKRRDYFWDYDLALRPSPWGDPWKGFVAVHRDSDGQVAPPPGSSPTPGQPR